MTTRAWVKDRTTGKVRVKHKQGDSRRKVEYWTAEAYAVDAQGKRKRLQARGATAAQATTALQAKIMPPEPDALAEALATEKGPSAQITDGTKLGDVLGLWINDPATQRTRATGTVIRYRQAIKTISNRQVGAGTLGAAPLGKITPRVLSLLLSSLTPAVAKTCRGILRQALTYAIASGATVPTVNGAFAMLSQRVERGASAPVKPTVAITRDQAEDIIAALSADELTSASSLPDMFRFLAGTGCRTSEMLALTWGQVDLDGPVPTVLINSTVNGAGQRQLHTKTRAGVRRLALPPAIVDMLRRRREVATGDLVFPSARRRNADHVEDVEDIEHVEGAEHSEDVETPYWASNITGVIREHLDRLGFPAVTARSFRRMVATELDEAGFTPRQIADQLGHSRPSVALDVYQSRTGIGPVAAATILG